MSRILETVITTYNDFGLTPIDPEIVDVIDWKHHACRRTCKDDAAPLDCYYIFKLESYQTMSKACYNCPFNITDCFRPHCIPADGIHRSLMVVNRQMPGPSIEVRNNNKKNFVILISLYIYASALFISILSFIQQENYIENLYMFVLLVENE